MAFFPWGSQFETGIMQIDTQHRRLVEMVNQLYEAMAERKGSEVLGPILGELVSYTKVHFKTEEDLMGQHGFPGLAEHQAKHASMTKKVLALKAEYDQGKAGVLTNSVGTFLKDWLTKHILGTDMQYAPFLKEKGC